MGLDKDTASARISRYESGSMSISLESLFELAKALEVPPAFLLADRPSMANVIMASSAESTTDQDRMAELLLAMSRLQPEQREEIIRRALPSDR